MQPENFEVGRQLGYDGVERVVDHVERYCECERNRIELSNQARITSLRAEIALDFEREHDLKKAIEQAPPPGDIRTRRRKALYYWIVTAILTLAAFFFSLLAFEPYRLGWKSYLYCLGIAIVTPFSVEKFLECSNKEKLIKTLATVAFVAALASLVLLALVRGDVLAQQVNDIAPTVTFNDDSTVPADQPHNSFYEETLVLLRSVMALLAIAMELGAGLALYDARRLGKESGVDPEELYAALEQIHQEMIARVHEITVLQNEAAVFEQRFWRDFYGAMLSHTTRKALSKLLVGVAAILLAFHGSAFARGRLNLIVLVDLTQSVAVQGHDGKTDSQKNLDAVARLLNQVPGGSHVSIVGITDNSFAQPYILLSADVGSDEGYFREKLANSHQQLVSAWKKRVANLQLQFRRTDVLGALLLSSQMFQQSGKGSENLLVIFSDMRQDTDELNLEKKTEFKPNSIVAKLEQKGMVACLQTIRVAVVGADNAGKDIAYWNNLRGFWMGYFKKSGAEIEAYSVLRVDPIRFKR